MNILRVVSCLVSAVFVLSGTAYAAPLYDIVALDVLPSSIDSFAFGLNDQRQVVGKSTF